MLSHSLSSFKIIIGSADNWTFLEPQTEIQILDFWHATEYLAKVSKVVFTDKKWLNDACHRLKHEKGAVKDLIKELNGFKISAKKAALPVIQTGMRWTVQAVDDILACRTLTHTPGRWKQTWNIFAKSKQEFTLL